MYIQSNDRVAYIADSVGLPLNHHAVQKIIDWLIENLEQLGPILVDLIKVLWEWLRQHTPPSMTLSEIAYFVFERPSEWPVQAFFAGQALLQNYPRIVQIVSFSIFFGPIVALFPALFLHEMVISILHNLTFFAHGLLSVDKCFWSLRSSLEDGRESLFSYVDAAGARYNKLTTDYWPFVVVRVLALCIAGIALFETWKQEGLV